MGGFEGGDEAGFWDEPTQISDQRYRDTLPRRCVALNNNVTMTFKATSCDTFTVESVHINALETQLLELAYQLMYEESQDEDLVDFFSEHKVLIESNSTLYEPLDSQKLLATFITHTNEICQLLFTKQEEDAILQKTLKNSNQ